MSREYELPTLTYSKSIGEVDYYLCSECSSHIFTVNSNNNLEEHKQKCWGSMWECYKKSDSRLENFTKHDNNKPQPYTYSIPEAEEALAKVLEYGAKKYDNENWRKCKDLDRYFNALKRHLNEIRKNGINSEDSESGLLHTYHLLANAAFIVALQECDK